eukprot:g23927.t1
MGLHSSRLRLGSSTTAADLCFALAANGPGSMLRAAVVALLLPGLLAEGGVEQDYEVGGVPPEDPNLGALEAAKDDATPNSLVDEWDKHMEGFTPELLLTFPLPGRTFALGQDIPENSPPVLIRGGFFASASEETSTVEFSIHDPKGNVIFDSQLQMVETVGIAQV